MNIISVNDIIQIHNLAIKETGGLTGVKDINRLYSAVAALEQNVFGVEIFPSLLQKAASLMRSLICDHPFLDGNKRTAMLCALSFLEINNIVFATQEHEIDDFAVKIATERLSIEQISDWLSTNSVSSY